MLCHIFSSGKHTDSKGNTKEWTNDDLDKICYQFKNVHSTVPVCIGHPQTNSPAYGWLNNVQRIGNNLYCDFKDVQEEFKTALKKGLFKNRSISLDKDLNIRHLAFLGGQAPAIKGLEQFCFSADENTEDYEIHEFQDIKEKEENVELEEMQKKLEEKDSEISKLKNEIEAEKSKQKIKEFEDFANDAVEKGNILPKHKESIVNILSACEKAENFSFSDGGEKSGVEVVKEFISSLKTSDFSDTVAKKENAIERQEFSDAGEVAKELEKIMSEQNVDLTTAFCKLNS